MLLRPGAIAAVAAVAMTVTADALAADQTVSALSGPNRFAPASVTVTQGEKVTWVNVSGLHNVRFDDGSYEEPDVPALPPWTVERTFTTPGTFTYLCVQHATSMSGSVTVQAAGTPGAPPPPAPGSPAPGGSPPGGQPPPAPGSPAPPLEALKVTLKASDLTPVAGGRVRLFGFVQPARDGRKLQIQKRTPRGRFVTVATTTLRDAGRAKSRFSVFIRARRDAVLRARVAGDDDRAAGISKTKKLDIQRP